jgi:hypothetical protein
MEDVLVKKNLSFVTTTKATLLRRKEHYRKMRTRQTYDVYRQ